MDPGEGVFMAMTGSIGPYRIVGELGAGAMGVVYVAEDTRLHRRVALKTLSREQGWTPDARLRLMHEAEAAGRLAHPRLVRPPSAASDRPVHARGHAGPDAADS